LSFIHILATIQATDSVHPKHDLSIHTTHTVKIYGTSHWASPRTASQTRASAVGSRHNSCLHSSNMSS